MHLYAEGKEIRIEVAPPGAAKFRRPAWDCECPKNLRGGDGQYVIPREYTQARKSNWPSLVTRRVSEDSAERSRLSVDFRLFMQSQFILLALAILSFAKPWSCTC